MANEVDIKYTKLFINNEFVDSVSGKTFPIFDPSTEKKIADVSEGDKADIDIAVAAAEAAFEGHSKWRLMDASDRGKLINKFADLLERDLYYIGALQSLEGGKVLSLSVGETIGSIKSLRYYAGWADKIHGSTVPSDGPYFSFTRKEPVGVVGQIIPWNAPVLMFAWKLGPALATGCTVVIKPAEDTPLCALYLASLIKEAGFPKGVVNVIPGYGPTAGGAISSHPRIRKVAFTGSVEVGKIVMAAAAQSNLKKVSLELGGKSPLIVLPDADIDEAVQLAHDAIFINQGQVCCGGSRTFVHEDIYDEFVKKAKAKAEARKVGDPFASDVLQGPQINKKMFNKVMGLVNSGIKEGARVECGGERFGRTGYFVKPTVFSNVIDEMRIAKEEIFGPVQSIIKYKNLDEAIKRANNTSYGLAAGIATKDLRNVLKFVKAAEAGSVWVNCFNVVTPQAPFGGYKESGIGRDQGEETLNEYLEVKTVHINM